MTASLSVIIPAFNEAGRLPPYLGSVRAYLAGAALSRTEVIVVDDGSTDGTAEAVRAGAPARPELVVVRHRGNLGKGAAVRSGLLAARGDLALVTDADGATPVHEERKLRAAIEAGADVAVGSRLVADATARRLRTLRRRACGWLFARAARHLLRLDVRDPQCGFKMFRREAARRLLGRCRQDGYLLDLELLTWAGRAGYVVAEVGVSWNEVPGSKVRLLADGWQMVRGVWALARELQTDRAFCPAPQALTGRTSFTAP